MNNPLARPAFAAVAAAIVTAGVLSLAGRSEAESAPLAAAPLAHMVFFTLADRSDENARKLIDGCQTYLTGHDGALHFSVGTRVEELDREVNDKDFDVALHVIFESKEAQDAYQVAPRHLQFIEECKDLWSTVRVFDSALVETPGEPVAAR